MHEARSYAAPDTSQNVETAGRLIEGSSSGGAGLEAPRTAGAVEVSRRASPTAVPSAMKAMEPVKSIWEASGATYLLFSRQT